MRAQSCFSAYPLALREHGRQALMTIKHQSTTLFCSETFSVIDFVCRSQERSFGPLEVSDAHYIVLVRRGTFAKRVGFSNWLSTPASFTFFNPGEEYRVAHPTGSGDECTAIRLDPTALDGLAHSVDVPSLSNSRLPQSSPSVVPAKLFQEHWRLFKLAQAASYDHCSMEERTVNFVLAAASSAFVDQAATATHQQLTRHQLSVVGNAAEFIASSYTQSHSLADVATHVGTTPFHLSRLFRAGTGYSICEFRNQLRLREAMRRIALGEKNLLALALDLGFCHHGHLGRHFKKIFGASPSEFRAELD